MKATRLPSGNYRALAYVGRDENGKTIQKSFTGPTPEIAIHRATEYQIAHRGDTTRTSRYYDRKGNLIVDPKLFHLCYEAVEAAGGIYCFTDSKGRPLYVGKSSTLYLRIPQSFACWIHEKGARIFYYVEDNNVDRTILEILLISELKPKYNTVWKNRKSAGRFKSNLDIMRDFTELKHQK